jgi:hypothetical protein
MVAREAGEIRWPRREIRGARPSFFGTRQLIETAGIVLADSDSRRRSTIIRTSERASPEGMASARSPPRVFERLAWQKSARTVRDPCRGRMLMAIGFRWRRAFGACHRLMSVTPPAWASRQRGKPEVPGLRFSRGDNSLKRLAFQSLILTADGDQQLFVLVSGLIRRMASARLPRRVFDRLTWKESARTVRDPCRGRMLMAIGFRWRRAFGACHRLMSVTPPAWTSRQN